MITAMSISISGLNASAARLRASASNVANARTTGALPTNPVPAAAVPYAPVDVVQKSIGEGGGVAGVSATYVPRTPAYITVYDPADPSADARGMVAAPNVDLAQEAVSQIEAAMSFRANLAALKLEAQTTRELLDVLA
jgi:flagellar basal-body rod protein FlgC